MKIQNYSISEKAGIKIKTNFKTLVEERDWLFKRHYYLQIFYDDKYKKTKKWNTKEAIRLRFLINTMRVREINLKERTNDPTTRFFLKYRDELIGRLKRDFKKLNKLPKKPKQSAWISQPSPSPGAQAAGECFRKIVQMSCCFVDNFML